ncbi:MAG: alpha/beta fold hydrolase [Rhodospirillales bacterium]
MTIEHTIHGNGPEGVIVCHGWFGDWTVFEPTVPILDRAAFTYAFMDQRGYGKSRGRTGTFTVEEIAADAIGLADALGWRRFHVVGHSMGGKVVQRVAIDARDRVKSVVAVTPVPASGVPFDDKAWGLFSGAADDDRLRAAIVDFSVGGRLTPVWVERIARASRETTTVESFRAYLTSWAKGDFSAEAKGVATPFKVMVGEHDAALNADFMRQTFLAWYPNAELEVIGNSGHYPMQEVPIAYVSSVERFLKAHA